MPEPAVQVTGVSKRYDGHPPVLDDVSLSVAPGTIVTLAGSNGSGKSTLLRCVAGLARHTGTIEVCGRPVGAGARARRSFGYLPQATMLPPHATVAETLYFFGALRGADPAELTLPDDFLRTGDTRIATLSGGQRQRVAIAVALLGSPPVLLLDEPVANLDEDGRATFWDVLRGLRDDGTTALIASPSPADLAGIGDEVVVLREGRMIEPSPADDGTPDGGRP